MPKMKNLAALAAAVQAGRRYARNNPDKAGKYVDQAAAFVDKQTKGKYSGQIDGVVTKVKGAAGLPRSPRTPQSFEANAGYGRHEGYGRTTPITPSTTTPSTATPPNPATTTSASTSTAGTTVPPVSTPPRPTVDPERTGDRRFPGSTDI
jgi:hypothetical protein